MSKPVGLSVAAGLLTLFTVCVTSTNVSAAPESGTARAVSTAGAQNTTGR